MLENIEFLFICMVDRHLEVNMKWIKVVCALKIEAVFIIHN